VPEGEVIDKPEVVSVLPEIADHVVATRKHNVVFDLRIPLHKDLGDESLISRCRHDKVDVSWSVRRPFGGSEELADMPLA